MRRIRYCGIRQTIISLVWGAADLGVTFFDMAEANGCPVVIQQDRHAGRKGVERRVDFLPVEIPI
ncbi:MAG TPA: hypothetical protein VGH38_03605 [Bryobacteraceae bacterium]|jgi:hypothetical protein